MLSVAGVGPGNRDYLTKIVEDKIRQSQHILAFGRIGESLREIRDDIICVNRVDEVLDFIKDDREILLLASGDPNFYGIVNFLKKKGVAIKEVIPGISSFQYMIAKLQKPWQDANFLSLHGRREDLKKAKDHGLSIILIDKDNMPSTISKRLYELGLRGNIYAGFNLSYENEVIISKKIGDVIDDISCLGVVLVENEMDQR